jgi:cyanophycinase-like exopeptidase
MPRIWLLLLSCCCGTLSLFAQGKLLLIGGGSELSGGWSDAAYQWAIQQSPNQRVAIISYLEEGEQLPAYLEEMGAASARNFWIASPELAREDWLLDSLATYDCLLLRGGDPWICGQYYRGTHIETSIRKTFQRGGVVGGHSKALTLFGDRFFSARQGDQSTRGLAHLWEPPFSLETGILTPYEGFIFEAEFASSHSLDRLLGFMARSRVAASYRLDGIGIAPETAFAIDGQGMGRVWGNGDVWVILDDWDEKSFRPEGAGAVIDSLRVIRLLEGHWFDIVSWEIRGLEEVAEPAPVMSGFPGELVLHGMAEVSEYASLLDEWLVPTGEQGAPLILVSHANSPRQAAVQALIEGRGQQVLPLFTQASDQWQEEESTPASLAARQFLFLDNHPDSLALCLNTSPLGRRLQASLTMPGSQVAILGQDAVWVPLALNWLPRWNLIPPTTFEATAQSQWANHLAQLAPDSTDYLLSLPAHAWVRFVARPNGRYLSNQGEGHALLLSLKKGKWGSSSIEGGPSDSGYGFREARLTAIGAQPFSLGGNAPAGAEASALPPQAAMTVFPNPIKDRVHILLPKGTEGLYGFYLLDGQGKQLLSHRQYVRPTDQFVEILTPDLAPGVYSLQVQRDEQQAVQTIQVLH